MDDILEAVDRGDLSLASLAGSADNENLIILSDWDRADLIRLLNLLKEYSQIYIHRIFHGAPC